jgi:hypothetical protein
MLAVVHDQEQLPAAQDLSERVREGLPGTLYHPQGLCNGLRYQYLLGERSELHQPHPVRVGLDEVAPYLKGEARLSGASNTGEGQKPRLGKPAFYLFDLLLTANEAAPRCRQVVMRGAVGLVCSTDAQSIPIENRESRKVNLETGASKRTVPKS